MFIWITHFGLFYTQTNLFKRYFRKQHVLYDVASVFGVNEEHLKFVCKLVDDVKQMFDAQCAHKCRMRYTHQYVVRSNKQTHDNNRFPVNFHENLYHLPHSTHSHTNNWIR